MSKIEARRDRLADRDLLTLEQSLALTNQEAMPLYERHLNKYLLQVYDILGLKDMDVRSAQGLCLNLADGRTILDFSGGFGVLGLGHNHPRILAAEKRCHEEKLLDCIKIAPHKLQGALAYNISRFLPEPLDVSFLAVSGAEANEAAMKLCERVQTPRGKTKFLCMQGAFHGKTHGALSMTTATDVQTGFLLGVPKENMIYAGYGNIDSVRHAIERESRNGTNSIIACFIETLRGTSCESPPPGYFEELVRICRSADILTVFDEIKVGMGRTGRFCAFQHEDAVPDVVTMAKTLGGGKREIGAMVTSQALFDKAYGNKQDCNLHSSSFSGMGGTCAIAIETLNILDDEDLIGRAGAMGDYMDARFRELQDKYPRTILEVRGKGCFKAIRFNFGQSLAEKLVDIRTNPLFTTYQTVLIGSLTRELYERHDILCHFQPGARDLLHFMPPFIVEKREIDRLVDALDDILARGLPDATVRFVAKNIKRVFARSG
ncbi:aspartate aminotransferase family protein [Qipengyuania sp. XHP0207]|uniref:aspartate aminotransferase family protein n=1 Tax=Qipengyuania sp. XHP0207 TaxID=3038078 RepID=UPI00241FDDEF|nr:aspartate aminotransferase family protein [Qipengyuania sp. XHP0207]MDG5747607.1 aspartate aminotransferase family protein [Qipengyuania sp. XHP0207]